MQAARLLTCISWIAWAMIALLSTRSAHAENSADDDKLDVIVVTAQKREQSINDVGMSIQAATGDKLLEAGVTDVSDLTKVTAGFFANESIYQTPVYTIRGIGFQDSALAAGPTVSVYVDQVPVPFSAETQGVTLDLQRVEVLKGPQGTLFGQNSTGGAVNYVANAPTPTFTAGVNASYGRFNTVDIEGFVSGPIAPTLNMRLAVRSIQSGDWQEEYTREATLGAKDFLNSRMILDWDPTENFRASLNVSGWRDKSEETMPQFFGVELNGTNVAPPTGFLNYPVAPQDPRAASWDANRDWRRDNHMLFTSLRGDYTLPGVTLTSLSSYQIYHRYQPLEDDGTSYSNIYLPQTGDVHSFYQELRAAGAFNGKGSWIAGANYERDTVFDQFYQNFTDSSAAYVFGLPLGDNFDYSRQGIKTRAVFGNIEFPMTAELTLLAGARYTKTSRDYEGCGYDAGDGHGAAVFDAISDFLRAQNGLPPEADIGVGQCFSLSGSPIYLPELERNQLDEHNVSWRTGASYHLTADTLLYANVSKGFKAGSFPTISVSINRPQLLPVTQESVLAYEVGVKTSLLDNAINLDSAAFYYDYKDKQILGSVLDPIFGPLNALVNVPKSHIEGLEVSAALAPVKGLRITPMLSYTETRIDGDFTNYGYTGAKQNFTGDPFPFVPKVQANLDAQYEFGVSDAISAFLGGNVSYASRTNSKLGDPARFELNSRALLDLRGGISAGAMRVTLWGRNVTNKFYVTNATRQNDADIRYVGAPATYGVTVNYQFR